MANNPTVLQQIAFPSPFIEAIKVNDESALRNLYTSNYHKVETLILKNRGTTEQAKDIYQEAFIAVWKNVRNNKFSAESANAINGYLYTIAKNKWMDYLRSSAYKKNVPYHTINDSIPATSTVERDVHRADHDKKLSLAMEAFEELGEACKNLLTKFYFEKKSMKEIADELQLDAASTRNKKYRCMQKLRGLVLEMSEI